MGFADQSLSRSGEGCEPRLVVAGHRSRSGIEGRQHDSEPKEPSTELVTTAATIACR
jgi:hypothetical protein